jgi:hypothetical protein
VSGVSLSPEEEQELYVILKPREDALPPALEVLLARVERALFDRLTIEELEQLSLRFGEMR